MKRNPKPFAVEIKKSRVLGQPHHLAPRRLFVTAPAAVTKIVQAEEPQAMTEAMAAPRILPSIVEPVWSNPEPAEPVHRKRSSVVKPKEGQIELALHGTISVAVTDGLAEAAVIADGVLHAVPAPAEADAAPVPDDQPATIAAPAAKPRTSKPKPPHRAEEGPSSEAKPDVEQRLTTDVREPAQMVELQKASRHRLTRRQAAAVGLPRSERWKRRLHPVAW
jgi:hypothetical protein